MSGLIPNGQSMRSLLLVFCLVLCVAAQTVVYTRDGSAIPVESNDNTPPEGGNVKYQNALSRAESHGGFQVDPPASGSNCVGWALNGGQGVIDPGQHGDAILSEENGLTEQPNDTAEIGDVIGIGSADTISHVGLVISRDGQTGEIEYISKTDDQGGVVVDRIKPDDGVHIYRKTEGSAKDDPAIQDARYEYKDAYLKWRSAEDKEAALKTLQEKARALAGKLQAFDRSLRATRPVAESPSTSDPRKTPEPNLLINPHARPVTVPPTCPPGGH
jgi:hypothetical protein